MRDFYRDRDPLRVELLPPGWERERTGFSYRSTATRAGEYRNAFTPYVVATIALGAFVAGLGLRAFCAVVPLGPIVFSWQVVALFALIALADALPSYFRDDPPLTWIASALFPFGVWAAIAFLVQPSWVLLLVALGAALLAADALAGNYLAWLLADVRIDADIRTLVRERWAARFRGESWLAAAFGLFGHNDHPRILDHYLIGFLTVPLAVAVALLGMRSFPAYTAGTVAVLALAAFLPLHAALLPRVLGLKRVAIRPQVGVVGRALSNWLNYNPRSRRAPGLHQSPYGPASLRIALFALTLAAVGASLDVTACYFPVLMLGPEGAAPWEEFAPTRWLPEEASAAPRPVGLTRSQRLYYSQLKSQGEQEAYLARLARAQERQARTPTTAVDRAAVTASPESWLLANARGAYAGRPLFVWSFILAVLLGPAVPVVFLGAVSWSVFGYELALLELRLTHPAFRQYPRDADGEPAESGEWYNPEWIGYVDAIHGSPNALEREHLFLGFAQSFDDDDQYPVLMHRKMLREHAHLTGDSGSGKTSRGIASVAAQLCRFAREREDCSLLVIDLKGDEALFHGVRNEARGLPFRWYREQLGCTTYGFNPLMQSHMAYFTAEQKARAVMDAFGLRYGDSGAERYFSDIQESVLYTLFRQCPGVRTFAELHAILQDRGAKDRLFPNMPDVHWANSYHVREQLSAFSRCAPLNDTTEDDERRIDLPSLFVRPQVVYFYVPTLLGGGANQQAAKFALYSLLTSALFIPPGRRLQVYCVIDEFQEIVGANLGVILKQARSFDLAMLLSNQLPADLDRAGANLHQVLTATTGFRWSFRASDMMQQKELQDASGEYVEHLRTVSRSVSRSVDPEGHVSRGESLSESITEMFRPAFAKNRILWSNFVEDLSIAHFSKGEGYTQFFRPFPLRTMFHISEELYKKRAREPWPLLPWPPGDGALNVPGPHAPPLPAPDGR
jgi:hypothetical protein